jgi:O-antigen/teichoic acid export membrane protein
VKGVLKFQIKVRRLDRCFWSDELKLLRLKDEFIKQTGLVFIGMGLFNLFNLLYHLFMLRYLSPVDYGTLNTLIAFLMLIYVPSSIIQVTITRFISSFRAQSQYDRVRELLRQLLSRMLVVSFSIFVLIVLTSRFLSTFLQISSHGLFVLLGIVLLFGLLLPVPWGGLQGLQKFGSLAFNYIVNGGLKFGLGVFFVLLGWGIFGALGAVSISYFVTIILSLFMLRGYILNRKKLLHGERDIEGGDRFSVSEVYRYFSPVATIVLCFMVLTNLDLILVKHFFTPTEAGYYSIAQIVGKIILFLPFPVVTVMFPKLASSGGGQEEKKLSILRQSLIIAGVLCGGAVVLSLLFPSRVIELMSGKIFVESISLIKFFCLNMTFFSLTWILLNYHLATQRRGFISPLLFLTLAQIGLILLFHKTLTQVLLVVSIVAACSFGINLFLAYFQTRKVLNR